MRTAAQPKSNKNGPKKKFTVENLESRLADISEAGSRGIRGAFEEAVAARLSPIEVTNEERYQLIAEAAYFRSEKRSFTPGYELEDWLAAEAEIERTLSEIRSPIRGQSHVDTKPGRR